ncbi:MAG TPA: hypothetical protein VKR80_07030 [Candidatus Limnocylindria bacterium]|nr:hypothetical protein [Candidatus Limnocylindria bacterium]
MPATADRIQLRHPDRTKKMPRIDQGVYAVVRRTALATLPKRAPGMTWTELRDTVADKLGRARGWDRTLNAWWYTTAVKLDLEARGEIERIPRSSPQRLIRK